MLSTPAVSERQSQRHGDDADNGTVNEYRTDRQQRFQRETDLFTRESATTYRSGRPPSRPFLTYQWTCHGAQRSSVSTGTQQQ